MTIATTLLALTSLVWDMFLMIRPGILLDQIPNCTRKEFIYSQIIVITFWSTTSLIYHHIWFISTVYIPNRFHHFVPPGTQLYSTGLGQHRVVRNWSDCYLHVLVHMNGHLHVESHTLRIKPLPTICNHHASHFYKYPSYRSYPPANHWY